MYFGAPVIGARKASKVPLCSSLPWLLPPWKEMRLAQTAYLLGEVFLCMPWMCPTKLEIERCSLSLASFQPQSTLSSSFFHRHSHYFPSVDRYMGPPRASYTGCFSRLSMASYLLPASPSFGFTYFFYFLLFFPPALNSIVEIHAARVVWDRDEEKGRKKELKIGRIREGLRVRGRISAEARDEAAELLSGARSS